MLHAEALTDKENQTINFFFQKILFLRSTLLFKINLISNVNRYLTSQIKKCFCPNHVNPNSLKLK